MKYLAYSEAPLGKGRLANTQKGINMIEFRIYDKKDTQLFILKKNCLCMPLYTDRIIIVGRIENRKIESKYGTEIIQNR